MNTTPKVSIVIPAYNRERYIGMAVRSVLDQTYRDLECIIVDDGSTDGTLEIAEQFAREDDRVRVLTDPVNKGAAWALKTGFATARGEYVGQVDSDDILEAQAVELTAAVLNVDAECGMIYTNYLDIDEYGNKTQIGWRCSCEYSPKKLLTIFMTFHFRLIRKSVYEQVGGIDPAFNTIEDYDLCLRLSEITQIKKINDFLYLYRQHSNSTMANKTVETFLLMQSTMNNALKRRNMDKTHKIKVTFNPTFLLELIDG